MKSLIPFFQYWRSTLTRDREIVDAVVAPAHRGPSAELRSALHDWPGVHYWVAGDGDGRLMLVRLLGRPQAERWWLHALLFLAQSLIGGAVIRAGDSVIDASLKGRLQQLGNIFAE